MISTRLRSALIYSVLVGCGLSVALIFTAIGPVLSTIAAHFGGGTHGSIVAQLMMTLPSIGVIVGGPMIGPVAERWGTRSLLFGALAAYGLFGAAGLYLDAAYPLLATRFLLGMAAVGVATGASALIADLMQGDSRTRALGYSSAVASAGSVISIFCAGSLADYGGWQLPFGIYGVAFVLLGAGAISIPRSPRSAPAARGAKIETEGSLWMFWPLYLAVVAVAIVVFMTGIQVSFLLAAYGIDKPSEQAWIIAAASAGATIGAMSYAPVQQRIGRNWAFMLCLAMMAAGNLLMGAQHQAALLALGCALNGCGGGMTVPYYGSQIIDRAPVALRPRALGFMYTMIFVGEFANPWVVTPLRIYFGIAAAFLIIGTAAAIGAACLGIHQWRARLR